MLIAAACSLALYCPKCGDIHVYDIPLFPEHQQEALICQNCGQQQAELTWQCGHMLKITVPCIICDNQQEIIYSLSYLRHLNLERIYCTKDNFELGYLGERKRIEELLSFNAAEFLALYPEDSHPLLLKRKLLLAILNCVHDLAAEGEVACSCGKADLRVDVVGSRIVLYCSKCGSYNVLTAELPEQLAALQRGGLELYQPRAQSKR